MNETERELERTARKYAAALAGQDPRELARAAREGRAEPDRYTYNLPVIQMENGWRKSAALVIYEDRSAWIHAVAVGAGRILHVSAEVTGREKEVAELAELLTA